MPGHGKHSGETKMRLLQAAEKLFAAKGYNAVSVRHITSAAGVHLAAVNYHFGSKRELYHEVFRQLWIPRALILREPLEALTHEASVTAEQIVGIMASSFLNPNLNEDEFDRHRMLMVQEMLQPSEAMALVGREFFQPTYRMVTGLLRRALGADVSEGRLYLYTMSIIAQVQHFRFLQNPIAQILGREVDAAFYSLLAGHITEFSMYGLLGGKR